MDQVETLLMFTAATRKADWKLHLAKVEEMLPYFHAHDQYNYGRWGPLYVADMLELRETDKEMWKYFDEGNFVINKHSTPFTAIDPDHAIEQEHKKMKTKGGFIGITDNEEAMDKHFIIAPTLSRLVQEFKDYAGIESRKPTSVHHELVGGKSEKIPETVTKLVNVLAMQGNPFLETDVFNLVTFPVAPSNISKNIEDHDKLGRTALETFMSNRMVDKKIQF